MIDPINLTRKLVNCKSITPEDDGAQNIIEESLINLGFKVIRKKFGSVSNLFAQFGNSRPTLVFAGHTDVVHPGNGWQTDPFSLEISGNQLIGRGVADMKGGIACFISAVEQFLFKKFNGSIVFLITSDEEIGNFDGMQSLLNWIVPEYGPFDACLLGEPASMDFLGESFCIGRRGSLNVDIISEGIQGHVAHPKEAFNPVPNLMKYLNLLQLHKWNDADNFFPETNLEITYLSTSGEKVSNIIPQNANAALNIRFNHSQTYESLNKLLTENLPQNVKIETNLSGNPFLCKNEHLINAMEKAIISELNYFPKQSTHGGTSDGRFIAKYCPVIEFGMISNNIHKINESVPIEDFEKLTRVYVSFLKNFFV